MSICVSWFALHFRYRCGTGQQGISRNCGDLYGRHLDCQWIDVTDVPPGTYQLRLHVNPDRRAPESDYRNNILSCDITFYPSSTYFTVANFKQSGIYIILCAFWYYCCLLTLSPLHLSPLLLLLLLLLSFSLSLALTHKCRSLILYDLFMLAHVIIISCDLSSTTQCIIILYSLTKSMPVYQTFQNGKGSDRHLSCWTTTIDIQLPVVY